MEIVAWLVAAFAVLIQNIWKKGSVDLVFFLFINGNFFRMISVFQDFEFSNSGIFMYGCFAKYERGLLHVVLLILLVLFICLSYFIILFIW